MKNIPPLQKPILRHTSEMDILKELTRNPEMKKYRKKVEKALAVLERNSPDVSPDDRMRQAAKIAIKS